MLEKIFRKKKKKEKSRHRETFLSLSANEVDVKAINFAITKDENGEPA